MYINHLQVFLLLSVGVLAVRGAPAPGLIVDSRTVSCCGKVTIPIKKGCLNRFSIRDMALAEVNGAEGRALGPFEWTADNMMLVQDCVNFTHQIHCDVNEIREKEERVDYHLTPCYKYGAPNTATASQGPDL